MSFSPRPVFQKVELLADLPGKVFSHKTAIYEQHLAPYSTIMDAQIGEGTILGKSYLSRRYADIIRWPIRRLEYSFVLHHALPVLERGRRQKVLGAGCGVTPLPHFFASMDAEVDAVDFDEGVIETLKTARVNEVYGSRVNHQWMDLRRLAFSDSTFDLVTCASVIESLANGDEALVLSELVRVLKPGGTVILTTYVGASDDRLANLKDRKYDEPFHWRTLDGLLAPYVEMLEGGLDSLKILSGLQGGDIERFWTAHRDVGSSWQGIRGYVAMGIVLSKTAQADCAQRAADVHSRSGKSVEGEDRHLESWRSDAADAMLKSQIHRTIELKRALEEKEAVIQEQKRAIEAYKAHMENCQHLQITGQGHVIHRSELSRLVAALKQLFGRKSVRDKGEKRQP
ncbi:class I SAM-dependent methyltransferase [Candidatus Methylomirabilis sp.]|uniref:class I SAM-dependent methyltransferase n=1 Tax=Candidatus Methylomirabilis sp. TaxID=2032687 RepID=UPI002A5B8B61|nr:class I SAM-dependent methyltransferase [Candidatus Methylomirabilis sp.]